MFLISLYFHIFARIKIFYSLWQVVQHPTDCSTFYLCSSAVTCFAPWNCFSLSFAVLSADVPSTCMSPALQKPSAEKPLLPSKAEESSSSSNTRLKLNDPDKYCKLCCAPFNNPLVAQQHYVGKKHKRNEARRKILEELGDKAVPAESSTNGKQNMSKCYNLLSVARVL